MVEGGGPVVGLLGGSKGSSSCGWVCLYLIGGGVVMRVCFQNHMGRYWKQYFGFVGGEFVVLMFGGKVLAHR